MSSPSKYEYRSPTLLSKWVLLSVALIVTGSSGCSWSWATRKHDFRSLWGDVNTYNRPILGFERRHHLQPGNADVNQFRWLHGPVPLVPSAPVAGSYPEREMAQEQFDPNDYAILKAPAVQPETDRLNSLQPPTVPIQPKQQTAPADQPESKPPVQIVIPPGNQSDPGKKEQIIPKLPDPLPPEIEGPSAFLEQRKSSSLPIHPVGYSRSKKSHPTAPILFARP